MNELVILRGLPGSGKSWAAKNYPGAVICSADHHFTLPDGQYVFKPHELGVAHMRSQKKCLQNMAVGYPLIVVDNTNTQKWEFELYEAMAKAFDYGVKIVDIFDAGMSDEELMRRNTHGVPFDAIRRMRARYER